MPDGAPRANAPVVEIVEYQPSWPQDFLRVSRALHAAIAGASVQVEHIGSTSVPGLCAKPVLDVMVGVASLADVEAAIPGLAALGYRYRPEHEAQIPQRRYFVKDAAGTLPRVHVHAVQQHGPLWRGHLQFRDALRNDARLAARYAALKRGLATSLGKGDYTDAKAPFIQRVLAGAAPGPGEGAA